MTQRNSRLNNVKSYWVNLDWIMNYKSCSSSIFCNRAVQLSLLSVNT